MEDTKSTQKARDRMARARAVLAAGNVERACAEIREAFADDPFNWISLSEGTWMLLEAEDAACAREALEAYVKKTPNHAEAWSLLGQVRSTCADGPGALSAFERAQGLEPGSLVYADQWVWALWTSGRSQQARKILAGHIKSGSLSVLGHHLLGLDEAASHLALDQGLIGSPARVCSPFAAARAAGVFFKSRFEEVRGTRIHLAYPSSEGLLFPWSGASQLVLVTWLAGGKYAGLIARTTRRHLSPIPILVVDAPKPAGRIQRRQHLRVNLPIVEMVEWQGRAVDRFDFVDLSAGGCALQVRGWEPQIADRVHCHLKLLPEKLIPEGCVVRVERSGGGLRVAIRFDFQNPRDQDRLARAVHQHQVAARRRGT